MVIIMPMITVDLADFLFDCMRCAMGTVWLLFLKKDFICSGRVFHHPPSASCFSAFTYPQFSHEIAADEIFRNPTTIDSNPFHSFRWDLF